MARAGRPRKTGPRHECGKLVQAIEQIQARKEHDTYIADRRRTIAVQRTRDGQIREEDGYKPQAVSPIGQYHISGCLGDPDAEETVNRLIAAEAYTALYYKAAKVRALPSIHAKCMDLTGKRGGSSSDVDESAPSRLDAVDAALGPRLLPSVRAVLIQGLFTPSPHVYLPDALDIIAKELDVVRQHTKRPRKKGVAA